MFNNVKIGTLLTFSFLLLCIFLLVVGGVGLLNLSSSSTNANLIYTDRLIPIEQLSRIYENILKVHSNNTLMLYERDPALFDQRKAEIDQWMQENNTLMADFEKSFMSAKEKALYDQYKIDLAVYQKVRDKSFDLIKKEDFKGALALLIELSYRRDKVESGLEGLIKINTDDANTLLKRIKAGFNNALIIMSILLGAALVLAVILSVAVPRGIYKPVSELVNVANKVGQGDLDVVVNYRSKNEFGELSVAISAVVENLRSLIGQMKELTSASSAGKFDVRADAEAFGGGYRDILSGVNNTLDVVVDKIYWYEGLLDSIPSPITVTDMDMNWTFVNKAAEGMLNTTRQAVIGKQCSNWNANICKTQNCGIARLRAGYNDTLFEQAGHNFHVSPSYLTNLKGEKIGHIEVLRDITVEHRKAQYQNVEVARLSKNLESLAQGSLEFDLDIAAADEFTQADHENFAKISNSFREAKENLAYYIGELSNVLGQMADGNLDVEATGEFKGNFAQMKASLNRITESFNEMMLQISRSSNQVLTGAGQVSSAAQTLSQGSTEQASSIEELSASIEDISNQIRKNADNARSAKEIADNASVTVENANVQMRNMIEAMDHINVSSQKIGKIIKTIDEIAFQTNILALNAAVEAARAGEAGKGFAVVADEVRNLASKSAEAAKDTTALIENSITAVQNGSRIASDTAKTLNSVVNETKRSSELIGQISQASDMQSQAIVQTTLGIAQISTVVLTNSATAEESAAASEELSGQADMLNQLVRRFTLRRADGHVKAGSETENSSLS